MTTLRRLIAAAMLDGCYFTGRLIGQASVGFEDGWNRRVR